MGILSTSCSSLPSSLLDSGLSPFGIEAFSFGLVETSTSEDSGKSNGNQNHVLAAFDTMRAFVDL